MSDQSARDAKEGSPTPDVVPSTDGAQSGPSGGHVLPSVDLDLPESLRSWERYQVKALIGIGGMGRVYKAWDPQLKRPVALKFLRGGEPAVEARFAREAQAQARVRHDHVCSVYEVGRHDGQPYIAMQLVEGRTLRECAKELDVRQRVTLMREVAEAVHAGHKLSLVHRDIKPANILVEKTDD